MHTYIHINAHYVVLSDQQEQSSSPASVIHKCLNRHSKHVDSFLGVKQVSGNLRKPSWNIRKCGRACSSQHRVFANGDISMLKQSSGYINHDQTGSAWANQLVVFLSSVLVWHDGGTGHGRRCSREGAGGRLEIQIELLINDCTPKSDRQWRERERAGHLFLKGLVHKCWEL